MLFRSVDDRFLGHMTNLGQIERGNVVVVRNGTVEYVKRIAGVPGDRISMERGVVLLNGLRVEQSRRETASAIPSTGGSGSVVLDERFPDERRSHQILDVGVTPQDDWPEVTLGAGQYVVLGDNRDNSLDSRFPSEAGGLGIVARDQIVGSVLFRYWRKGVGFAEGQL